MENEFEDSNPQPHGYVVNGKYKPFERIGAGTYGRVYKAENLLTKEMVALKRIVFHDEKEGFPATALREIAILSEIEHENIVKVLEICASPRRLYIVFELMQTDLKTCIEEKAATGFTVEEVRNLMWQLLNAVAEIHSVRVMHRDIKPGNILMSGSVLKLGDFGMARTLSEPQRPYTPESTTLCYRSPEMVLLKSDYSTESDIWSCACVFYELLKTKLLFTPDSDIQLIDCVFAIFGRPSEEEWPEIYQDNEMAVVIRTMPKVCIQSFSDRFRNTEVCPEALDLLEVAARSAENVRG